MTQEQTITSKDGTTIAYSLSGSGPLVVLIAAALSDRGDTNKLAKLLSEKYTVINYDRRGRGKSTDTKPYSPQREVEDIEALIDAHGDNAFLFGSSAGAALALEAAQGLGKKVRGVIAFEAPLMLNEDFKLPDNFKERLDTLIAEGKNSDAVKVFFKEGIRAPGAMVFMMRLMVPAWKKMVAMAPTLSYEMELLDGVQQGKPIPADKWNAISVPVHLVTGSKSAEYIQTGAEALRQRIPGATLEVLQGEHHATPIMNPKALLPLFDKHA